MKKLRMAMVWSMIFVIAASVLTAGRTTQAAVKNTVKSVDIQIGNKKVTKKTYTLEAGQSKSLKVSASPKTAVRSVRYKSHSPETVSVDRKGKITAGKKGTAKIEATVTGKSGGKKTAWVKIKVTNPVVKSVSIKIDKKDVTGRIYSLENGKSIQLAVSATPGKAVKSIVYKSENVKVADVSKYGTVTAKMQGTARITVTVTDKYNKKKSAWIDCAVTEGRPGEETLPGTTPAPEQNPIPTSIPEVTPEQNPSPTPEQNPIPTSIPNVSPEQNPSLSPTPKPVTSNILIAYFSATGTTEKIAEYLAEGLNADLYEIVPSVPYTSSDLNYNDSSSRSSIEQNDSNARPEISGAVENMEKYETVFLGA